MYSAATTTTCTEFMYIFCQIRRFTQTRSLNALFHYFKRNLPTILANVTGMTNSSNLILDIYFISLRNSHNQTVASSSSSIKLTDALNSIGENQSDYAENVTRSVHLYVCTKWASNACGLTGKRLYCSPSLDCRTIVEIRLFIHYVSDLCFSNKYADTSK